MMMQSASLAKVISQLYVTKVALSGSGNMQGEVDMGGVWCRPYLQGSPRYYCLSALAAWFVLPAWGSQLSELGWGNSS